MNRFVLVWICLIFASFSECIPQSSEDISHLTATHLYKSGNVDLNRERMAEEGIAFAIPELTCWLEVPIADTGLGGLQFTDLASAQTLVVSLFIKNQRKQTVLSGKSSTAQSFLLPFSLLRNDSLEIANLETEIAERLGFAPNFISLGDRDCATPTLSFLPLMRVRLKCLFVRGCPVNE